MSIKVKTEGAKAKVDILNKAASKAIGRQLTRWGGQAKIQIFRNVTGGIVGKYKGGRRSGDLGRSIDFKPREILGHYQLTIGSYGVKYARILEEGGTITPKRKKFLTIPMPGVKGMARNYPDAFFVRTVTNNLFLAKKYRKNDWKPLFVLVKKAEIPAFHWLQKSVDQKRSLLDRMLSKQELLRVAKGIT